MTSPLGAPLSCLRRREIAIRTTPIASRTNATNRIVKITDLSISTLTGSTLTGEPDQCQRDEQEQSDEQKPLSSLAQASGARDLGCMLFVKSRPFIQTRTLRNRAAAPEMPGFFAIDELADFGSVDDQPSIDLRHLFSPRRQGTFMDGGWGWGGCEYDSFVARWKERGAYREYV